MLHLYVMLCYGWCIYKSAAHIAVVFANWDIVAYAGHYVAVDNTAVI